MIIIVRQKRDAITVRAFFSEKYFFMMDIKAEGKITPGRPAGAGAFGEPAPFPGEPADGMFFLWVPL